MIMTKLKTLTSLLLVVALLFSLTACGNTEDSTSSLAETDDTTGQNVNKSFADYAGLWSESDLSWEYGGMTLEISVEEEKMIVDFRCTQGAPDSTVAKLVKTVELSEFKDKAITIDYEDDGWGNSGTIEITFMQESILADFKNVVWGYGSWGFSEATYKLERNDNAYKLLEYDMEDYYEKYPEFDPSYEDVPSNGDVYTDVPMYTFPPQNTTNSAYDLSKASGILASMGMTEEEFKESCTPLRGNQYSNAYTVKSLSLHPIDLYDYNRGKQFYDENPDELALAKQKWKEICDEYPIWQDPPAYGYSTLGRDWYEVGDPSVHYYEKYKDWETYAKEQVYAVKGYEMLYEDAKKLFDKMREYPNKYIGQGLLLLDANSFYESLYGGVSISVNDVRDDTSNPNILFSEYDYLLYVVFTGSNGSTLNFDLIAIEKTREN